MVADIQATHSPPNTTVQVATKSLTGLGSSHCALMDEDFESLAADTASNSRNCLMIRTSLAVAAISNVLIESPNQVKGGIEFRLAAIRDSRVSIQSTAVRAVAFTQLGY